MTTLRPWSSAEQAELCAGLRAGTPPLRLCHDLDRPASDVHRRITSLLGDPPGPVVDVTDAELDVLWLRLRISSINPARPTADDVVAVWEDATDIALPGDLRDELTVEVSAIGLTGHPRHRLVEAARAVVGSTGMLDLDDWAAAAGEVDPVVIRGGPATPSWIGEARRAVLLSLEDVVPTGPREAVRSHLLGPARPEEVAGSGTGDRWRGIVEILRAAGTPGSPASALRDALLTTDAVRALTSSLGVGFSETVTVGMLGGRHETEALRVAGRIHTRWTSPPSLGRGVRIRRPR